ncbi:uncharacterized protein LOC132698400 [Cylas formicarius]|uniref:uncharacterized protein LOC132698400 n=1 Tax=Cylas formicarius TaxID=197179 RepID=UPI002958917F|nr:uncharacterized protein LOC132698400 [Cylas formicarius]
MSNTKVPPEESLPKTGKVSEVCQEWMVREDSALAYRLQSQEFTDHLSGNKFRNAVVREDFPRAKNEQIKEQIMAEQAAAIYHRMLEEQEEIDKQVAKELAEKLEKEDKLRKRAVELRDQDIARQLLENERLRVQRQQQLNPVQMSPHKAAFIETRNHCHNISPHRLPPHSGYQSSILPKRQSLAMPLPHEPQSSSRMEVPRKNGINTELDSAELYMEPYNPISNLSDRLDHIALPSELEEIGIPVDEVNERRIQEEQDAKLARKLQEQESSLEDTLVNRDRMLAIEAQDKELAKLLQERERAKAKRARERARQKGIARKQQQQPAPGSPQDPNKTLLMPDDSYAFPADIVTKPLSNVPKNIAAVSDVYAVPNADDEDINYSLPIDMIPSGSIGGHNISNKTTDLEASCSGSIGRPTHLDLRSPLNKMGKPRYPEPDVCNTNSSSAGGISAETSPLQHSNIAMAIDPTYTRRSGYRPPSSYDTTPSTVTTSTSSSSPGVLLSTPVVEELEDDCPAPPYMPIQGQRRTSSLEKKKKKSKDSSCKQQ